MNLASSAAGDGSAGGSLSAMNRSPLSPVLAAGGRDGVSDFTRLGEGRPLAAVAKADHREFLIRKPGHAGRHPPETAGELNSLESAVLAGRRIFRMRLFPLLVGVGIDDEAVA